MGGETYETGILRTITPREGKHPRRLDAPRPTTDVQLSARDVELRTPHGPRAVHRNVLDPQEVLAILEARGKLDGDLGGALERPLDSSARERRAGVLDLFITLLAL